MKKKNHARPTKRRLRLFHPIDSRMSFEVASLVRFRFVRSDERAATSRRFWSGNIGNEREREREKSNSLVKKKPPKEKKGIRFVKIIKNRSNRNPQNQLLARSIQVQGRRCRNGRREREDNKRSIRNELETERNKGRHRRNRDARGDDSSKEEAAAEMGRFIRPFEDPMDAQKSSPLVDGWRRCRFISISFFFHLSLSVSFLCFDEGHRYYGDGFFFFLFFFFWPALSALSQRRGHISSGECRRRRAHLWRADALRARRAPTVLFSGIIIIILILILIIIIILIFLSLCLGSPLAFYPLSFFVTIYCCIEV